MADLDLGLVGNCNVSALIDRRGRVVWFCLPRFDGDPVFHGLLGAPAETEGGGVFTVEIDDQTTSEQSYQPKTAILRTLLRGEGGAVEIVDFAPRFYSWGRTFRPQMLIRRITPIEGSPRIRVLLRPRFDYGAIAPEITHGSNHIRYLGGGRALRLTTDAPLDYLLEERAFKLTEPVHFVLGPDETLDGGAAETVREFERQTAAYWRGWVQRLALPLEWQDAVTRAAITLKLCNYEGTGAIVAAMTTSIPEAPGTTRTWDYRYCWVRDAFFVVRALNSLAAVRTMETYFQWIMNIVDEMQEDRIQPVYGITLEKQLTERIVSSLPGYLGMGPVRVGNQAHEHAQHDTYGNVVLGVAPAFFDTRLSMHAGTAEFEQLESIGAKAFEHYDKPDAGLWELRSRARVHTSSSVMCWAACDRLAKIARHLGLPNRAHLWADRAETIRTAILDRAWSERRQAFVESFEGEHLDASVLLMGEVGFIDACHPRFVATVERIEQVLARGPHVLRYEAADDFGKPTTAFNVCAFWRLDALARMGRWEEAREIFEALLATRNHLGMMSEDTDPATGVAWGNFPQTYSMVGIINGAMRLSRRWDSVL